MTFIIRYYKNEKFFSEHEIDQAKTKRTALINSLKLLNAIDFDSVQVEEIK